MSVPPSPPPGTEPDPQVPSGTDSADPEATEPEAWEVGAAEGGERIDRHVAQRLGVPRNQVQRWLAESRVEVNGVAVRASGKVEPGDRVRCARPAARTDDRVEPEDGPLSLLYEDEHLVVLDKPAGLAMHPGAGRARGTLAHRLVARYPEMRGVGGAGRPGIVHRLDLGTSGVLVVARSELAYQRLSRAFAERRVSKSYLAVAYGQPQQQVIRIEAPIARHRHERKQMAVRQGGRPAASELARVDGAARLVLFAVRIETGRTHQIRVHLKHAGFPIIGDPTYGEARWRSAAQRLQALLRDFPRPALHAWRLAFEHPATGAELTFEAPPAADLEDLWLQVSGRSVSEALALSRSPE